ncbi:hypothetical protein AGABI1DRAFT_82948 [Agaricus bisporus var. burnettii JB137-S8]|uniref:Uncharacterized protein n=1 Tax=Agaricus bisporus var. burnettii (strain JB137-S8 / ATCC MYA-4627 / FGSC 10392) TaxID=597362 RepID=K5XDK5_AGABU|nr:uncharacterized protein AGABI1DRAFT_82948 [Agaricus bisporus var. burnettii JB137-S8]EKM81423.1 hypothetical protein AGABI1DRAFT_82948 [Agaricus bisporus var. burnettii JB137-S8]
MPPTRTVGLIAKAEILIILSWTPALESLIRAMNEDIATFRLARNAKTSYATPRSDNAMKSFLNVAVAARPSWATPRIRIIANSKPSKKVFRLNRFSLGFSWILWRYAMMERGVA